MTENIEKKLRYFVIGEDKPFINKKIEKCRDFGVIETECAPSKVLQNKLENNDTHAEKPKMPQTINGHTYLGGILDSMKSKGIVIVDSD